MANPFDIPDISPTEAWEKLQQDPAAVVLDVRSTMEFQYVGHPIGAVHVPLKEPPGWRDDPEFVAKARAALAERAGDKPVEELSVMTICRSGKRSAVAAEALLRQGFREVYNIAEGFEGDLNEQHHRNSVNGWRFHNLPWEQT